MRSPILIRGFIAAILAIMVIGLRAATPAIGDAAPNFTLKTLDEKAVELKRLAANHPVVLVVLRGWPGYQCPLCTKQVQEFISKAGEFDARNARVLMVYPGPAEKLKEHAREFAGEQTWPENFTFLLDPDYTFTNAYGLRWNARNETAYPSTFVIDTHGKVRFATISKEHGGRVKAENALAELAKLDKAPKR